ncbi:MAG: cohesin domain-containing protein, partial [Patescibacteria group bacterium]
MISNRKKILFFILAAFFAVIFVYHAEAATLSLSPSVSSTITVGNIFNVSLILNTSGAQVDGADIRYLNYNPALLEVQDANSLSAGVQISPGSLMSITNINTVDVINGRIQFSQTVGTGLTYSGTGVLASVNFKALATGSTNVTFDFTAGVTADTNIASAGTDVLTAVTNGSYTIIPAGTVPPPPVCGNGIIETGEQCDSSNLGGASCTSQGYSGGTLSCSSSCTFNTSNCSSGGTLPPVCGNSIIETGEQCDSSNLGGGTCSSLGYSAGTLSCNSGC